MDVEKTIKELSQNEIKVLLTLKKLKDLGLKIAVVTDADFDNAMARLKKTEFLKCFDLVITIEDTMKKKPERIKEVNEELEEFGVKVLKQFAVLGPYDFVNLVEAPDNEAIFKLSVELGSRGTIQITSMPAITIDELIKSLKG